MKPPTENDNPKKKPNNKTNKQQTKTTNNKKTSKQNKTSTLTSNNITKFFKTEATQVTNITSAENNLHITPASELQTLTSKDADNKGGPVKYTQEQLEEVVSNKIMSSTEMAPHSSDGKNIIQSKTSLEISNQSESDLTQRNKVFTSQHLGEEIRDQMTRGLEDR